MSLTVKITEIDGKKTLDRKWHYLFYVGGADTAFCTGQVFRYGDIDAKYEEKDGKVTCEKCIKLIKLIKAADY